MDVPGTGRDGGHAVVRQPGTDPLLADLGDWQTICSDVTGTGAHVRSSDVTEGGPRPRREQRMLETGGQGTHGGLDYLKGEAAVFQFACCTLNGFNIIKLTRELTSWYL